jgi:hypothetical protein
MVLLDVIKFSKTTKSPSKIKTATVRFGTGTTIKNSQDPFHFTSNPSLMASSILDKFPVSTPNSSAINNLGMNEGGQPVFFHTHKEDSLKKTQIILSNKIFE